MGQRISKAHMIQFALCIVRRLAFKFPPIHNRVDQRSRLFASYMAKGGYQLIKFRVYSWPAYIFYPGLVISNIIDTAIDFGISLSNKLEMTQSRTPETW